MLFNSFHFFIFFGFFFFLYYLSRNHLRIQNSLILIGSYIFYGSWDERFLVLIIVSTVTDYVTGLRISGEKLTRQQIMRATIFMLVGTLIAILPTFAESLWILGSVVCFLFVAILIVCSIDKFTLNHRKWYLFVSICVNLGLLGVFKYTNFFSASLVDFANVFGWHLDQITLNVILPVGISFYTFQTMSYSIDIYRGKMKPTHNLLEMASFVAFFPQLVAGPIERASHLLPQFFKSRQLNKSDFTSGLWLFIWGLYKKVVIADNLAPIADRVFSNPETMTSGDLIAGLIAFTFQIYCDFSGYSDMARGSARMLGFDIMLNFKLPYFSRTPSEFWQRWHISLSSWLRDYLYIPLGGNRGTTFRTYRNLTLTMVLGGLWHGANWTFIAWGAYQGFILVLYRLLAIDNWLHSRPTNNIINKLQDILLISIMFILIVIGWLFFRADSLTVVASFLSGIFYDFQISSKLWHDIMFYLSPLIIFQLIQHYKNELELLYNTHYILKINARLFALCSIIFLASSGEQQFIYFDF